MAKLNYLLLTLLAGSMLIAACRKSNNAKQDIIDDKNLTTCPDGANGCSYLFSEHADFDAQNITLKPGAYRLFWRDIDRPGMTDILYIKAPLEVNKFELSAKDIKAGRVITHFGCPSCYAVSFKAVGGYVKGINTTPTARADQAKWLVEAKIYREAEGDASIKDTLYVKQYFDANFVID
ncbi:MAG: hypothetical protein EOP46_03110 [Sphingobacteriaceae bacterium]|nr:MAG: hypothetical protein EOP46_03110 [Sphingobacteriaceae bacterium]